MNAMAGAATPVKQVTTTPKRGGVAVPVYAYASAPTDGRAVLGQLPVPIVVLQSSDLKANGGTWELSGQPYALPVVTSTITPIQAGAPMVVYVVGGSL